MNVLLFAGAGASVELGVPAMRPMAEQLVDHLREHSASPVALAQVGQRLANSSYDMEHLIEELDNIIKGGATSAAWGIQVPSAPVTELRVIRQEAEWFVMHVCERIQPSWAKRLWVPALRAASSHGLTIATTNYDRAVELAGSTLEVEIVDGFKGVSGLEFADWCGLEGTGGTCLLKLHGSTDWYHTADGGSVVKLRHPIPLFGQLTLSLNTSGAPQLASAAVLPSREKKVTQPPYPAVFFAFQAAARIADVAFFLGTSLRDPDIRDVCATCSARVPTYCVSPKADYASGVLPNGARVLKQTASRFLIDSLPTFLTTQDPNDLSPGPFDHDTVAVLELLAVAGDRSRPTLDRSSAIEGLARARVRLAKAEIEELLNDSDAEVQLFALALIPDSLARDELALAAKKMASEMPTSAFGKEVQLLADLLGATPH